MTSNDYSEDKLIQQSTAEFMEHELKWESVFAFGKEVLGENGTLGRTSEHEVLLRPRFKAALKRLNPWMSDKQLEEALLKMTEHVSSASLMQINEQLDDSFKDENNPLRMVFVCAMWLTGFDVPTLGTLYLDKPMKAHTLMQTIARANRVAEGKANGLIVDYIGIVKALRKALAEYTANESGNNGQDPTVDKVELIENVMKAKDVSKELLTTIRNKVEQMSQPFEKMTTKAEIQLTILEILWDELPPSYPEESIGLYRDKIYEYVSTIYAA